MRWLLVMLMAVRSSAVSTFWPLPLLARSISAASTPTVLSSAELKSTNGALARVGTLPSPERCMAPDMAWPIVSKPTRVA